MRRVRNAVLTALVAGTLALGAQPAPAYCDPNYEGCTNSCKETARKLEKFAVGNLIVCPQ